MFTNRSHPHMPLPMVRFGIMDLKERALAAVDEAARQSHNGTVERTLALRFALAFLVNFAEERWPFDRFWKALQVPKEQDRWAEIISSRNAIYRAVGIIPRRNI